MTVHNQAHAEETVDDGVVRPARDESGDGEGNKPRRKDTLECPVVRTVRLGGRGERSGVVHAAPVDGCNTNLSDGHATVD